ncbi:signal peptidase I [Modestobacter sp. L9-4]|uniref:signal peptidase I n=1 Tax=Modestobacter sp. L9-4 TaxID=2851567 RepID=UPI001C7743A1|nr:signal peptidase I [Modestobacter sp. L9-4]QXG75329.1 signal peptidase I [Modestobacter sp. L9-4]
MTTALAPDLALAFRPARQLTGTPRLAAGLGERAMALVLRWTVRLIVTVAVLAFALLAVGPHVLGYRTMTMLTGSMTGTIDVGDVEVVTPLPVAEVTEGMIIAYHVPIDDHHLVTHRVIGVDTAADGTVTVETKGDANAAADPWKAQLQGDTAYQVRAVVPGLGHVIQALRSPVVSQALRYVAPALLAGWLLLSIWRPTPDQRTDGDDA